MARLFLLITLVFSVTFSFGQKENEKDFYSYLQTQIKAASAKQDTIIIVDETGSCFGNTWKAVLKPQSNYTTVAFYVDKRVGNVTNASTSLFQAIIDTSYSLQTKRLLDNLESELKYLTDHLVINMPTEYSIEQGNTKRKFTLEKALGLYYWLRFNKSPYLAGQ
jgi:hypothetical protein